MIVVVAIIIAVILVDDIINQKKVKWWRIQRSTLNSRKSFEELKGG